MGLLDRLSIRRIFTLFRDGFFGSVRLVFVGFAVPLLRCCLDFGMISSSNSFSNAESSFRVRSIAETSSRALSTLGWDIQKLLHGSIRMTFSDLRAD